MKFYAVIGAGFGDEGKGQTVHNLCRNFDNCIVIRYCGGPQAGHNVIYNGISHIFANFGSGTLVNIPTYISKHCLVDPIALLREYDILKSKGINPRIYIDEECKIITPWDKANEKDLAPLKYYGSYFTGISSTIERCKNNYIIRAIDLKYPNILLIKMDEINEHCYPIKFKKENLDYFFDIVKVINNIDSITIGLPDNIYESIIFEGAQGLLLDREYGFFPHVSRGNTGSKNIIKIIDDFFAIYNPDIEFNLVSRAYQTRHGIGPMTNLSVKFDINDNENEINMYNDRQGEFIRTMLDLDLLSYSLNCDEYIRESDNKKLIITCIDDLKEFKFTHDRKIISCKNKEEFVMKISDILKINMVLADQIG